MNLYMIKTEKGYAASDGKKMYFADRSLNLTQGGLLMNVEIKRNKETYAFVTGDITVPDAAFDKEALLNYFKDVFQPKDHESLERNLSDYSIRLFKKNGAAYACCYGVLHHNGSLVGFSNFRMLCQIDGKIVEIMTIDDTWIYHKEYDRIIQVYRPLLMEPGMEYAPIIALNLEKEYGPSLTLESLYPVILNNFNCSWKENLEVYRTEYGIIGWEKGNRCIIFNGHRMIFPGFSTKAFEICQKIQVNVEDIKKFYLENNVTAADYWNTEDHVLEYSAELFNRKFTAKVLNPNTFAKATDEEKKEVAESLENLDQQVKTIAKYCNKNNVSELAKLSKRHLLGLSGNSIYPWR